MVALREGTWAGERAEGALRLLLWAPRLPQRPCAELSLACEWLDRDQPQTPVIPELTLKWLLFFKILQKRSSVILGHFSGCHHAVMLLFP